MYPMTRKKLDNQINNNIQTFNVIPIFVVFKEVIGKENIRRSILYLKH